MKVLELSTAYKAIVRGASPSHIIDVHNISKTEIKDILNGTSKSFQVKEATEVKVAIMLFQWLPPGMSPSVVVAARPQTTNESSDFVQAMEVAATKRRSMTSWGGQLMVSLVRAMTFGEACVIFFLVWQTTQAQLIQTIT